MNYKYWNNYIVTFWLWAFFITGLLAFQSIQLEKLESKLNARSLTLESKKFNCKKLGKGYVPGDCKYYLKVE